MNVRYNGRDVGRILHDLLDLVGQDHRFFTQIPIDIGDQAQLPLEPLNLPYPQVRRQERNTAEDRRRGCQSETSF